MQTQEVTSNWWDEEKHTLLQEQFYVQGNGIVIMYFFKDYTMIVVMVFNIVYTKCSNLYIQSKET